MLSKDWWTDPGEIFGGGGGGIYSQEAKKGKSGHLSGKHKETPNLHWAFSVKLLRLCPHSSVETFLQEWSQVCRRGHRSLHLSWVPSLLASVSVSSVGMRTVLQSSLLSRLLMSHACSLVYLWHSLNLHEERDRTEKKKVFWKHLRMSIHVLLLLIKPQNR